METFDNARVCVRPHKYFVHIPVLLSTKKNHSIQVTINFLFSFATKNLKLHSFHISGSFCGGLVMS